MSLKLLEEQTSNLRKRTLDNKKHSQKWQLY